MLAETRYDLTTARNGNRLMYETDALNLHVSYTIARRRCHLKKHADA